MKCNKNMQTGTKVKMVNCLEAEKYAGKIWITESEPWCIGGGTWIVLLKGYGSGFSVKCLEVIDETNLQR